MIVYERPVRFEDVDAAGIVFFSRFLNYCHEAMEAFFGQLHGGYARLITERRLGLPAVHVDAEFDAPLKFGDVVRIETSVVKVGRSSCTFRYAFHRATDGTTVASIRHVVVMTDLGVLKSVPFPHDVREALERHLQ
jgi:4-hydroxybenzoyl-CoA thioesterase